VTGLLLIGVGLGALLLWSSSASAASAPSAPDWPPSAATQQDLIAQATSATMAALGRGLSPAEQQIVSSAAEGWPSEYAADCAERHIPPTSAGYRAWATTQFALLEMWLGQMQQGGPVLPSVSGAAVFHDHVTETGWWRR
jgi:hypothetical protein